MDIKRGIIETEAVGESEIEGVTINDQLHMTLGIPAPKNGFTYCGRPNREYIWSGLTLGQANISRDKVCQTCLRLWKG